jgi:hypothetical protein
MCRDVWTCLSREQVMEIITNISDAVTTQNYCDTAWISSSLGTGQSQLIP